MLTDSTVLYAPIVVSTKSTKVTITRGKSKAFRTLAKECTNLLVANSTGFYPAITFNSTDTMYQ